MTRGEAETALADEMARARLAWGVPALAAVMVNYDRGRRIVVEHAAGRRRADLPETLPENRVRPDDRFNVGSVTKVFTGFVIARLVEERTLTWTTRVRDIFTEYETVAGFYGRYRGVEEHKDATVEALMAHRSLLPYAPSRGWDFRLQQDARAVLPIVPSPRSVEFATPESLRLRRHNYVLAALADNPESVPRYGGGSIVCAAMAERAVGTGELFEDLARRILFEPLGMHRSGFGRISTEADPPDGVWQHLGKPPGVPSLPHAELTFDYQSHAPAGTAYVTTSDMGRFIAACLPASDEPKTVLSDAVLRDIQTPSSSTYGRGGWQTRRGSRGSYIGHNGNNNVSYAELVVYPTRSEGYAVMANISGDAGMRAVWDVTTWIDGVISGLHD